jgi:hypothetical protein
VKFVFALLDFVRNRSAVLDSQRGSGVNERVDRLLAHLRSGLSGIAEKLPEEAFIAALLDPRHLDTYIPDEKREQYWTRLEEIVSSIGLVAAPDDAMDLDEPATSPAPTPAPSAGYASRRRGPPPSTSLVVKKTFEQILQEKAAAKGKTVAVSRPYRDLVPNANHDVAGWWAKHEAVYPGYAKAARRYLAIPATSAPCERLFSTAGRILEKRRASIKPDTLSAILIVHENQSLLHGFNLDDSVFD